MRGKGGGPAKSALQCLEAHAIGPIPTKADPVQHPHMPTASVPPTTSSAAPESVYRAEPVPFRCRKRLQGGSRDGYAQLGFKACVRCWRGQ